MCLEIRNDRIVWHDVMAKDLDALRWLDSLHGSSSKPTVEVQQPGQDMSEYITVDFDNLTIDYSGVLFDDMEDLLAIVDQHFIQYRIERAKNSTWLDFYNLQNYMENI